MSLIELISKLESIHIDMLASDEIDGLPDIDQHACVMAICDVERAVAQLQIIELKSSEGVSEE